jgi:hypothetical protein
MNVTTYNVTAASPASFQSLIGNATAGNQVGVISATAGGPFADVSHTDAIPAGVNFTNTFTNFSSSFFLASQSVAFATPDGGGGLMLRGVG